MPCSHIMYHRYGYKLSGTRSQRLIPVGADFPLPNTCNSSFCGYQNKPLRPHLETKSNTHDTVCDVTYSPFSSSQCLAEMSCAALVSSVIRVQEEKKRMELLVIFFKAGLMCMAIKGQVHPKKKKWKFSNSLHTLKADWMRGGFEVHKTFLELCGIVLNNWNLK